MDCLCGTMQSVNVPSAAPSRSFCIHRLPENMYNMGFAGQLHYHLLLQLHWNPLGGVCWVEIPLLIMLRLFCGLSCKLCLSMKFSKMFRHSFCRNCLRSIHRQFQRLFTFQLRTMLLESIKPF